MKRHARQGNRDTSVKQSSSDLDPTWLAEATNDQLG